MRRFSQRNSLVTLSDINITPLLDLAFVLLIIFIITTPLLEQGLDLRLPVGGQPDKPLRRGDIKTVEIGADGTYMVAGRRVSLADLERDLVQAHRANTNLAVLIRADRSAAFEHVFAVTDMLGSRGISRVNFRASPKTPR